MQFFRKSRKSPGWMAISFQADGLCAAHLTRPAEGKPEVDVAAFFAVGEKDSRSEVLEKLSKDLQLSRYQCTTLLGAGEYQLLTVDAPNVQPEELKTAIRWRIKDMLDYHVDDATVDVLDIPADKNAAVRNHSMYAVAARNQVIQERQTLFADLKLPLSVIDIPEMAQRNVSSLLEQDGRGVAFLSFDELGGLLTVTYSGELYLSRRIDLPLAQLQQTDVERLNSCYDRITLELQRSLDHFDRQYHFIAIAKLTLGPLGDAGEGLRSYLGNNLYIPVELLDLDSILDLGKVPDLKDPAAQLRYFMTIGAALRVEETVL